MQLSELIQSRTADISEIATHLDALSHAERVAQLSKLGRARQRSLYEKAGLSEGIGVDFFVPSEVSALSPVNHFGRNTLPLPKAHNFFEKRFCRSQEQNGELVGYNHSPSRRLIGPGYFVAYSTEQRADWKGRGGVVIDYFRTPITQVPGGWPEVIPNRKGLQRFVFLGTRDFMRRVSTHVSIGAAYKADKPLDHYFVLCRPD